MLHFKVHGSSFHGLDVGGASSAGIPGAVAPYALFISVTSPPALLVTGGWEACDPFRQRLFCLHASTMQGQMKHPPENNTASINQIAMSR